MQTWSSRQSKPKRREALPRFAPRMRPAAPVDLSDWPHPGRVALETLSETCLEMVYDGVHRIDGETIDYTAYPLYGAPGAAAEPDTGRMLFAHGDERVELDFGIDPQQTLLPMRVIG